MNNRKKAQEKIPIGEKRRRREAHQRQKQKQKAEREAEIQRLRGDKTKSDLQRETVLAIHAKKRRIRLHTISEILGVYRSIE